MCTHRGDDRLICLKVACKTCSNLPGKGCYSANMRGEAGNHAHAVAHTSRTLSEEVRIKQPRLGRLSAAYAALPTGRTGVSSSLLLVVLALAACAASVAARALMVAALSCSAVAMASAV